MKSILLSFVLVAFLMGIGGAARTEAETVADGRMNMQKTFDHGTLVEYLITLPDSGHDLSMVFSRRRTSEDSGEIADSYLKYGFKYTTDGEMIPMDEQGTFLKRSMKTLHDAFGSDLKLRSVSSREYLGTKETEKRAILAFKDFEEWQRYLNDNRVYAQWEIYEIVLQRWREAAVFSDLADTFEGLGYTCQVTGFEKLFIYKAGDRPFYSELSALGIKPDDRFPYPGVVHFELKRKQRGGGSEK